MIACLQYEYEFDERGERVVLGKGTFGTVYAGRELTTQVKIAIKEFKESSSSECASTSTYVLYIYEYMSMCYVLCSVLCTSFLSSVRYILSSVPVRVSNA